MKPETRIELIKMSEKAKRAQAEDQPTRWKRVGYVGAALLSLFGVFSLKSAITLIAEDKTDLLGTILLLVALIITISPWYFIIRFNLNRNIELLCEAILSVNQQAPMIGASPVAPLLPPRKTRSTRKKKKK